MSILMTGSDMSISIVISVSFEYKYDEMFNLARRPTMFAQHRTYICCDLRTVSHSGLWMNCWRHRWRIGGTDGSTAGGTKVATLTFKVLESGEPGYLNSRIGIATFRRTLRSSADTRKLLWFHQGPRSTHELFDTRHRRSGTVYHWTFAALHLYNRSSQD